MYQIEHIDYFYCFLAIPFFVLLFLIRIWIGKRLRRNFSPVLLERLTFGYSVFKPILKMVLFLMGFAFLVIALANPKIGFKMKTLKRQGVDIVFALDVSRSMLAEDVAPSRLEKAKQIITKVIEKLGSDRIGIIIYAGSAYPLLPITTDHASSFLFLSEAGPDMVSSQGTAISEAIARASDYYDDENTNRFLVLLSDGESHEKTDEAVVDLLKEKKIKLFAVGIGTQKGAPIPLRDASGKLQYKRDREGKVVVTRRDENTLKSIASMAKGIYLNGNITKNPVEKIAKTIVNAQKQTFETKQFSDYKDQFQWFIGAAILFLTLEIAMFSVKTGWIKKLNLFNSKSS